MATKWPQNGLEWGSTHHKEGVFEAQGGNEPKWGRERGAFLLTFFRVRPGPAREMQK